MRMTLTVETEGMAEVAAAYRRELTAHCYRMLGSVQDAEDAVQETMLRAWRAGAGFEGRSSVRVWLYRIATNVCLRALERRARLPLPSGLGAPARDGDVATVRGDGEAFWLEPVPDAVLGGVADGGAQAEGGAPDPGSAAVTRASVRLAFVSALQHLPARQRAALILRDVYAFSARETAEILETSVAGANSALQRARSQMATVAPDEDEVREPASPELRRQVERYLHAFERSDISGLTEILREDVRLEMPPMRTWFHGAAAVERFLAGRVAVEGRRVRMVPVAANGQPGFASFLLGADGAWSAHAIHVLEPTPSGLARICVFLNPALFEIFGLTAPPGR